MFNECHVLYPYSQEDCFWNYLLIPPIHLIFTEICSAGSIGVRDAVLRLIHGSANRATKLEGRQRNAGAHDRQDQGIFSSRSAALIGPEALQKGHIFYPYSLGAIPSCPCSAPR